MLNTEMVIFLDLWAAWVLLGYMRHPVSWRPAVAGGLIGLSAVSWPTGLLVAGVLVLWALLVALRGRRWGKRLAPLCLFIALAAVPVLIVAVRNRVVGKDWVLISANGGINFYTGSRPQSDGVSAVPTGIEWEQLIRETNRAGITKPSEVSRYWFGKGWENIKAAPARTARLTLKRAALFFNAAEPRNNIAQAHFLGEYPWLRSLPGFGLIGPLWFLGLGVWAAAIKLKWKRTDGALFAVGGAMCLAFAAARWVSVLPFFVCDRFRVVAVPFMLPFAGLAVVWVWDRLGRKCVRDLAGALAVLALTGVFVNVDWFDAQPGDFAREHFFLGRIALQEGDVAGCERELLVSLDQRESADAWLMLSVLRVQRGDFSSGAEAAAECLALVPDVPSAHGNRAAALLELGQAQAALPHADEAVRLDPKVARYRLMRATIHIRLGHLGKARGDLEAARYLHGNPAERALYQQLMRLVGTE